MKKTNYQSPVAVEIVTDCLGVLCSSPDADNSLGGYLPDVLPGYGEDE